MQAKTFGTWASFLTSVGSGALTQTPDYQWLALPVAIVSGSFFFVLVGMYLFSNCREIIWLSKLIEPSHVIILGLVIACGGAVWQWRRTPPHDPKIATLESQVAALDKELGEERQRKVFPPRLTETSTQIAAQPAPPPKIEPLIAGLRIAF